MNRKSLVSILTIVMTGAVLSLNACGGSNTSEVGETSNVAKSDKVLFHFGTNIASLVKWRFLNKSAKTMKQTILM